MSGILKTRLVTSVTTPDVEKEKSPPRILTRQEELVDPRRGVSSVIGVVRAPLLLDHPLTCRKWTEIPPSLTSPVLTPETSVSRKNPQGRGDEGLTTPKHRWNEM